jgi:hypothetical protein
MLLDSPVYVTCATRGIPGVARARNRVRRSPAREGLRTVADASGAVNPASLGVDSPGRRRPDRMRPSRPGAAPTNKRSCQTPGLAERVDAHGGIAPSRCGFR